MYARVLVVIAALLAASTAAPSDFPKHVCLGRESDEAKGLFCTISNRTPYEITFADRANFSSGATSPPHPERIRLMSWMTFGLTKTKYQVGRWWTVTAQYEGGLGFAAQLPGNQSLDFAVAMNDPVTGSRKSGVAFGASIGEALQNLNEDPYSLKWSRFDVPPVSGARAEVVLSSEGRACCFEVALERTSSSVARRALDVEPDGMADEASRRKVLRLRG